MAVSSSVGRSAGQSGWGSGSPAAVVRMRWPCWMSVFVDIMV